MYIDRYTIPLEEHSTGDGPPIFFHPHIPLAFQNCGLQVLVRLVSLSMLPTASNVRTSLSFLLRRQAVSALLASPEPLWVQREHKGSYA